MTSCPPRSTISRQPSLWFVPCCSQKNPCINISLLQQADIECALVDDLQKSVESSYVNHRPLHHLPTSQVIQDLGSHTSRIFVTTASEFRKLTPSRIQDIFKDRHILLLDVDMEELDFDLDSLSNLGDIQKPCRITGKFL